MNEFAQRITQLRKERSMTQEQLAQELGITAQAVSKWENGQSYPDILLLPKLAEVYGVRVDELLGCAPEKDEDEAASLALPWDDDPTTIHAVLFAGHTLIGEKDVTNCREASRISFQYEGAALNIQSVFSVECGDVGGNVTANGGVNCDNVSGDVRANGSVNCDAVEGNLSAGGSVTCDDVRGSVRAGGSVTCDTIGGNATAGGSLDCDSIGGDAHSGSGNRNAGESRRGRSFNFSFDSKEFGRTMEEFGRKMSSLGEELGQQINKKISETFDNGAANGVLAQKIAEKFNSGAEDEAPVDLDALDKQINQKLSAAFGGDFEIVDEESGK